MMRNEVLGLRSPGWALGALFLALVAVGAALVPAPALAGAILVVAAIIVLARSGAPAEMLVALYWLTYVGVTTIFRDRAIDGLFYPFYVLFLVSALLGLVGRGLRVDPRSVWAFGVMLFLHVVSLIGYRGSMSASGLEPVTLYVFGVLVMLQFRSRAAHRPVVWAAVLAAVGVSTWIILSAIQGGFTYRGDVEVDQNVLTFYIGLGFVPLFARWLHGGQEAPQPARDALSVLVLSVMIYAMLLLASRGLIVAVALTVASLVARQALRDVRRLVPISALIVAAGIGLLLPGGQGVFQRFQDPNAATGGGRTLIWSAVIEDFADSGPRGILIGHGLAASNALVAASFTALGSTHNTYLQVLYDLGVVGLLAFLALHIPAWLRGWGGTGADAAFVVGILSFLLLASFFINTSDSFLYWAAVGWVLAVARHVGDADRGEP